MKTITQLCTELLSAINDRVLFLESHIHLATIPADQKHTLLTQLEEVRVLADSLETLILSRKDNP